MKKKILILVFILALVLCLAFVSSASSYIDYSEIHNSNSGTGLVLTYFSDQNNFESTLTDKLGVIIVSSYLDSSYVINSFGFTNIEYWSYLLANRVSNADEFLLFIESGIDSGYWNSSMNMYKLLCQFYQEFWLAYQNWYNNDYYYSLVDCQNFHILRKMYYSFDYNGINYKSVIEQFCPKCNYSSYELSSDVLNFLDVFLDTATDDEILNFDFYNTLKFYIFENEGANVSNFHILDEFVDKLEKATIIKSNQYVEDWLESEGMLTEPMGITGEIEDIGFLLDANVLPALTISYNKGYKTGYNTGESEGKTLGYTEGVNAALTRMESWLSGENILFQGYDKDGDIATVAQYLDGNIPQALKVEYNTGKTDGISIGETTSDSLKQGIFAIISAPLNLISSVLNFELFGINLFALVSGLLTLALVFFVIKKLIKG